MTLLNEPSSERQWIMYEALRKGATVEELHAKTAIKPWFIQQMKELVELEETILQFKGQPLPDELLIKAKDRFPTIWPKSGVLRRVRAHRQRWAWWQHGMRSLSGVENAAVYSTYHQPDRAAVSTKKSWCWAAARRIGRGSIRLLLCARRVALRDAGAKPS